MPKSEQQAAMTYDPELGPGYFVQIRSDFLRSPVFTPIAVRLYLVLCSYTGAGETAWPGQKRLATECGVSEPTIRKAIKELAEHNLVESKRQGLNRTNLYHIRKLPLILPERKNLPFQEQKNLTFQNANRKRSRPQATSAKLHTVEEHTDQIQVNASPLNEQEDVLPERTDDTPSTRMPQTPDELIRWQEEQEKKARINKGLRGLQR